MCDSNSKCSNLESLLLRKLNIQKLFCPLEVVEAADKHKNVITVWWRASAVMDGALDGYPGDHEHVQGAAYNRRGDDFNLSNTEIAAPDIFFHKPKGGDDS